MWWQSKNKKIKKNRFSLIWTLLKMSEKAFGLLTEAPNPRIDISLGCWCVATGFSPRFFCQQRPEEPRTCWLGCYLLMVAHISSSVLRRSPRDSPATTLAQPYLFWNDYFSTAPWTQCPCKKLKGLTTGFSKHKLKPKQQQNLLFILSQSLFYRCEETP